jgi:hypothetical protein
MASADVDSWPMTCRADDSDPGGLAGIALARRDVPTWTSNVHHCDGLFWQQQSLQKQHSQDQLQPI